MAPMPRQSLQNRTAFESQQPNAERKRTCWLVLMQFNQVVALWIGCVVQYCAWCAGQYRSSSSSSRQQNTN